MLIAFHSISIVCPISKESLTGFRNSIEGIGAAVSSKFGLSS